MLKSKKIPAMIFIIAIILMTNVQVFAFDLNNVPDNTMKVGDDLYSDESNAMSDPEGTDILNSLLKPGPNENTVYFKFGGKWYDPFALTSEQFLDPAYAMTAEEVSTKIVGFGKWYKTGDVVEDISSSAADKTALNAAIATAEAKVQSDYTSETWAPFATALTNAQTVSANSDAAQTEVDNAKATLEDAMAGLIEKSLQMAADEISSIYPYIGDITINEDKTVDIDGTNDISTITEAMTNIADVTSAQWDTIINGLFTSEVKANFNSDEETKQAIIDFITGLSQIYYSSDETSLFNTMVSFRDSYTETFETLFGSDANMADLFELLYQTKQELPGVASSNKGKLKDLISADNSTLVTYMNDYTKEAMAQAIIGNSLSAKLSAIGWSTDKILDSQQSLSNIVNSQGAADLALGKAYIRLQTELLSGNTSLIVEEEPAYTISILGLGESEGLASLVNWHSTNQEVVLSELPVYLKAVASGSSAIIIYRDGAGTTPENDWIYYFDVEVSE